jgi:hypothetical protein
VQQAGRGGRKARRDRRLDATPHLIEIRTDHGLRC